MKIQILLLCFIKMDVLIPPGFDRKSIDKCMIDELCNFIPLDDIKQRLGTIFVILYEKYFAVYTAKHHNVLFDYNCRNFVMSHLYPRRGNDLYYEHVINSNFNHKLKLIDNIFYNNQLPYLIFINEGLHNNATEENTIIENYTEIDTQKFADIVKSKSYYDKFFVVYLGSDQYMCCIVDDLKTYQYSSRIKYRVIEMLYENINNLAKLKAEDEELKMRKPLERINNFQLVDVEGHPVEEKKDYYLNMFDQDEDILDIYDEKIYATYYKNFENNLVVQCLIKDDIYYLVYNNKYMYVNDIDIGLSDELPEKNQRLQFHLNNNRFKVVQWNQNVYLTINMITSNYSAIEFDASEETVRWGKPLELFLKRC